MGIFSFLKKENRASTSDPVTAPHWGFSFLGLTKSGKDVTVETVTALSTTYACVKIISETIASLPLIPYERLDNGERSEASTHPIWSLVKHSPNKQIDAFTFKEWAVSSILLKGNAPCFKEINGAGQLIGLWPLNAGRLEPQLMESKDGTTVLIGYIYNTTNHGQIAFTTNEIFNLKDWGNGGLWGTSRISQVADVFGNSIATEEYSTKFFANSATPSGILKYPGKLKEDLRTRLIESWEGVHQGSSNAQKTAMLEGGVEWEQVSINPGDSQLLESRQWNTAEIARIFRVPTILIGGAGSADKSNTFASAEQQTLSFVTYTIGPLASRIEQQMNQEFFGEDERRNMFVEFKLEGLLRGDIGTRASWYETGRGWGFLSPNDIRRLENLPSLGEGGNEYIRPMNYEPIGADEEIQDEAVDPTTALNGAQVTAMLDVVNQVATGLIPKETGVEIVVNSFPVSREQAEAIFRDIVPKEPTDENDTTEVIDEE